MVKLTVQPVVELQPFCEQYWPLEYLQVPLMSSPPLISTVNSSLASVVGAFWKIDNQARPLL